ncbi:MptD family putative ECF transporter S component [Actinomyces vulturis]|uniref:MptD family putative ECF transporter S component n=1 Tax=Actinomyces vulturis TaxID=1857645 RepID=UPI000833D647|nr:MptD family putative ECF transporter S component [Actinomyces vulturis]
MSTQPSIPALTARSQSATTAQKVMYTGVFTAVYFVIFFALGMLGFFGPQFMFVSGPLAFLLEGTGIMVFFSKVRSFGALTALGTIIGILMVLTGHAWTTLVLSVLMALIADLLARSGQYVNAKKNIIAYAILQLWYFGAWLPIFYNADAYYADITRQMGQVYSDEMRAIFTPTVLMIFIIVDFFLSLIGGWIGTKVLRSHFQKAGIA